MPNLTTMESYGWATEDHFGRVRKMSRDSGVGSLRRCVWFERSGNVYEVGAGTLPVERLEEMDARIAQAELFFGALGPVIQAALSPGVTAERNRVVALMRLGADVSASNVIR